MKKIIVFLILSALVTSCMTEEKAHRKWPCTSGVSFIVKRDTFYIPALVETKIPPDSAWLKALIACDSSGVAYIKEIQQLKNGTHARPFVNIGKGNILTAGAKVDSFCVYNAYKQAHIRESVQTTITLPPVEVKFVPKYIEFFAWSGSVAWGLLLVLFGIRIFGLIKKVWPI